MSSAAEYYRNRDWKQTVKIYSEITSLDCDEWNPIFAPPQEIYQYYAIAYEQMGKFDSSEFVLLDGLQKLPDNIELRKRLAYSYKRQGKLNKEIIEYERLADLSPEDINILNSLSKLYKDNNRYEDQILIIEMILKLDGNNEIAQSELALAFENSGRDPLDVYRKRYEDNLDNLSYGLDYSDRLMQADFHQDAVIILKSVIKKDPTSKIAYRKLAESCIKIDDLEEAAIAYNALFKIDPRDERISIELSNIFIEIADYDKALKWADKSIDINSENGDSYAQKAKVYYYGWDNFRKNPFSTDDRIVAKLAYNYFIIAENKGYRGIFNKKAWLDENSKDVMYGKAQWFMAEDKVKRTRKIKPVSADYFWITEALIPEESWK
tara:strand:- start:222 stop:1358 length:1137 start_codon:yes stop_codon:yes gene_type:complete